MKPGVYRHKTGRAVIVPHGARSCSCAGCPAHPGGPVVETTDKLRDGNPVWVYESQLEAPAPRRYPTGEL